METILIKYVMKKAAESAAFSYNRFFFLAKRNIQKLTNIMTSITKTNIHGLFCPGSAIFIPYNPEIIVIIHIIIVKTVSKEMIELVLILANVLYTIESDSVFSIVIEIIDIILSVLY